MENETEREREGWRMKRRGGERRVENETERGREKGGGTGGGEGGGGNVIGCEGWVLEAERGGGAGGVRVGYLGPVSSPPDVALGVVLTRLHLSGQGAQVTFPPRVRAFHQPVPRPPSTLH